MITAMDRTFLLIGAVLGFLGVLFGAFGAHILRSRISPEMLAVFETGIRYHMYHAFAVLIVAAAIGHIGSARLLVLAGWFSSPAFCCFQEVFMRSRSVEWEYSEPSRRWAAFAF